MSRTTSHPTCGGRCFLHRFADRLALKAFVASSPRRQTLPSQPFGFCSSLLNPFDEPISRDADRSAHSQRGDIAAAGHREHLAAAYRQKPAGLLRVK